MDRRLRFGVFVILIGLCILLAQISGDIGRTVAVYWPLILIIIGVLGFSERNSNKFGSLFFVIIGLCILLKNLNVFVSDIFWPVVLILIGLWFVFPRTYNLGLGKNENTNDIVDAFAAFSSYSTSTSTSNFKGGSALTLFGGAKIDLTSAELSPDGAVINTFTMFGGVDVIVPQNWSVSVSGLPLFGGFENKTLHNKSDGEKTKAVLKVYGLALFGGITVRN